MATEDILINDGDGFVSLTALAAEQVGDAKLPIESDDGTVKLDSPSANTFTVSTGGVERLSVSEPETVIASRYVKQSPTAGKFSQHQWTAIDDTVLSTITQYNADYDIASLLDVGPLGLAITSKGNVGLSFAADKSFIVGHTVPRLTVDVNKIRCDVPVQTPSVSGLAATDASIALGADCQILVGATQSYGLRVRADGNVAVGGAGAASSRLAIQGSVGGANSYGINNINTFNETVTTGATCFAAKPSFLAPSVGYCVLYSSAGLDASLSKVGRLIGYEFTTAGQTLAKSVNRAFATDLPAGVGGQTNYAFFASGTATSYFAGGVKTPSVSGLAATEASIALGAELLTSNHTPTKPNSIATKQTVDDKIWVGTTAAYNQISPKLPGKLYCLTD